MVTAVGFAWVCLSVTPVGKRVFLLIVPTIPTVMHGMTTAATTVKKAALGRSKSPPLAVQKQQLVDDPPNSPKGREFIEGPSLALPKEGTEKVPFFYDQNGKCLRFVTSLSANHLK